jgi:hypothetical protein
MFKHAAASLTGRAPNVQSALYLSSLQYAPVFCDVFALNAIVLSKCRLVHRISSCTLQGIITVNVPSVHPDNHIKSNRILQLLKSRGRILSPGRVKNFLFSTSSRPALGFT